MVIASPLSTHSDRYSMITVAFGVLYSTLAISILMKASIVARTLAGWTFGFSAEHRSRRDSRCACLKRGAHEQCEMSGATPRQCD